MKFFLTVCFVITSCSHYDMGENSIPLKFGPLAKGCPDVIYPDWKKSPYNLPYPIGKSYMVGYSNCSAFTHAKGRPDQFGYDFDMNIGSVVTAARKGKVVFVEESGVDYHFPNNRIVIDHGDNTFGQYMHFTKNGVIVDVGQTVYKGEAIGYSGVTGLAGYPHLHFVVSINGYSWPYVSIPITFRNTMSNRRGLKTRTEYMAY